MNQKEALQFLSKNLKNQNLIKHCLAVEAVMRGLAKHFNEDEEKWRIAGLLHDIDYEQTKDDSQSHSLVGAEMLENRGVDTEIIQAIKTHNKIHGIAPETKMAKVLFCVDPITGLIVAATLVLPTKKLADLTTDSVLKRFKESRFAAGADREVIAKCEEYLELSLEKFIEISLKSMQTIADDLGL